VADEMVCITNSRHPEFAEISQKPCTVTSLDPDEEGLPRRAVKGFLCSSCWEKTKAAIDKAVELVVFLRSIESGGQGLSERVSSSLVWRLPIPPSWLVADGIMMALGAAPIPSTASLDQAKDLAERAVATWRVPEMVVATVDGAVNAVLLYRHVQTALAGWPQADADRPMPSPLRCPKCEQLALWYRAPLEYLDDLEVKCGSCKEVFPWEDVTKWTGVLSTAFEVEKRAAAKARREARRKEMA
jgi:phage FluMu protein Com